MKRFADPLLETRVATRLMQKQLGFALGITKSSVSAWEIGRETPSSRMLPELHRQLRRSLDELICGAGPADASQESPEHGLADDASPTARDEKERTLLVRYRGLPAKQRAALLDLLKPAE